VAEVALYQGADRQQVLEEGARKEGRVTLYTSNSGIETTAREFGKKYPFLSVDVLRAGNEDLVKRVQQEYQADRVQIDAFSSSGQGILNMQTYGYFQPYWTPELSGFAEDALWRDEKNQLIAIGDRENYGSVAWNTQVVDSATAPKTIDDLLDPRWKGKMATSNDTQGVTWFGEVYELKGEEFVKRLAQQQMRVLSITPAAITDLVVSGEVPLSPVIGYANAVLAKQKGAPIEWYPVEPVDTTLGYSGLMTKAPHPFAAMLLLDYLHSREGQTVAVTQALLVSPRADVPKPGLSINFTKTITTKKYTPDEFSRHYADWERLFKQYMLAAH
jgi:iron(III) transport system substrate-binding protein